MTSRVPLARLPHPDVVRRLAHHGVVAGSVTAAALSAHGALNLRYWRRAGPPATAVTERVSILLPARDEAAEIASCLLALRAQTALDDVEILVLDDASTDGTAGLARAAAGDDPRVRVLTGSGPPPGWLGKPAACDRLAHESTGSVLVFVDADVRLAPHAVAAAVTLARRAGLDLVCPYPRQLAGTLAERLVQPLLQWSFLTTLPLRVAESSPRPSLGAANGQFLVVDADAYRRAGGHAAVRDDVLDDLALLRAVKAAGGRGTVTDGTDLATCRMYRSWPELRDGYSKSLWTAFGSPAAGLGTCALLLGVYVVPPLAALTGSRAGALGYAAAVAGRVVVGRRAGSRTVPDAAAHPASVLLLAALVLRSVHGARTGRLRWKGRALPRRTYAGRPSHQEES